MMHLNIYSNEYPFTLKLNENDGRDYFNNYIRTYLMKDVIELGKIIKIKGFFYLSELV